MSRSETDILEEILKRCIATQATCTSTLSKTVVLSADDVAEQKGTQHRGILLRILTRGQIPADP